MIIMFGQSEYFSRETYKNGSSELLYRLSLPDGYDAQSKEKYPLILFLHGAGERGNDNEAQLTHIDKVFENKQFRDEHKCIIIIPQCPKNKRWVEVDWTLPAHKQPEKMSENLNLTMSLLYSALIKYNVDKKRIYVVGLSMGGFGVWDLITRFPYLFAAAVPICGGGDEDVAAKAATVPIWAFHGAKDKLVMVSRTRNMIKSIKDNNGNPKYTEYPTKGHLVWNLAFENANLWTWLFEQKKSEILQTE